MLQRQINFIRQQGFETPGATACAVQYSALQFQPRVIGVIMLAGVVLRSPLLFLALSAALWWSALLPKRNPFDLAYNRLIAVRRGLPPPVPAPGPRRFAQALAATLMAIAAGLLLTGRQLLAGAVEAFLLAAIAAVVFRGFCLASFVFHLLERRRRFRV